MASAVYRILQSSNATPAVWLVVSIVLINTFNTKFQDTSIPDPIYQLFGNKILNAFVDDIDLWNFIVTLETFMKEQLQMFHDNS